MFMSSYWEEQSILNKMKNKYSALTSWDENKTFRYIQDSIEKMSKKYYQSKVQGAINWVEKCHSPLNEKYNKTLEKIDLSFKAKNMTELYETVAAFEEIINEIIKEYKNAVLLANEIKTSIYNLIWDESTGFYEIKDTSININIEKIFTERS